MSDRPEDPDARDDAAADSDRWSTERWQVERARFLADPTNADSLEPQRLPPTERVEPGAGEGAEPATDSPWRQESGPTPPSTVGPYTLQRSLGSGAYGLVFLAHQTEPVSRLVALKLMQWVADPDVILRFGREQQAMARMNHEAIAQIHGAGQTDQGQPWFAMEWVEGGEPITAYCDARTLDLRRRIRLFQEVCAGVQHAHQKQVIHRDLKPGNILVASKGNAHKPKIIDFGLATATERSVLDDGLVSMDGQVRGTPEYMSPEQVGGRRDDLDSRTDVYSLGVILFELLTGQLPFPSGMLPRDDLAEIQRVIRLADPGRPSGRIQPGAPTADRAAQSRDTSPRELRDGLRGDLDWIALKAIAKEADQRYPSAAALAEDLQRHLDGLPVEAAPPSSGYRMRKFVARHRIAVAASCAVLLSLLVGIGLAVRFALRAQDAAVAAERAREAAREDAQRAATAARRERQAREDAERIAEERDAARQEAVASAVAARDFAAQRDLAAEEAVQERDRFTKLSFAAQVDTLLQRFHSLEPKSPSDLPGHGTRCREWLAQGLGLVDEAEGVRTAAAALRALAMAASEQERAAFVAEQPGYPKLRILETRQELLDQAHEVARSVVAGEPSLDLPEAEAELATWLPEDQRGSWRDRSARRLNRLSAFLLATATWQGALIRAPLRGSDGRAAWALAALALRKLEAGDTSEERRAVVANLGTAAMALGRTDLALQLAEEMERLGEGGKAGIIRQLSAGLVRERHPRPFAEPAARLRRELEGRFPLEFQDEAQGFLHRELTGALALLERMRASHLRAAGLRAIWGEQVMTLTVDAHAERWARARAAIAAADGEVASTLYGAAHSDHHPIQLEPQIGLIPLGMNPDTGLWEFLHLRSAWSPGGADLGNPVAGARELPLPQFTRRPGLPDRRGWIDVQGPGVDTPDAPGTGIVFVLVPGGRARLGGQSLDPDAPLFDPDASPDDRAWEVDLPPFFIARHELTQGQWRRLAGPHDVWDGTPLAGKGWEPSSYPNGFQLLDRFRVMDDTHPVESVDWFMARHLLGLHGLRLPSEAEWEYAGRAGAETPYWCGPDLASLGIGPDRPIAAGNVLDQTTLPIPDWPGPRDPIQDGFGLHAPVDRDRANRFGLHGVHGNVFEWTRDAASPDWSAAADRGTPDGRSTRIVKGGGFARPARLARFAWRVAANPTTAGQDTGLRAARDVER